MILAVAATVVFHDAWKIKLNAFVKRLFEKEINVILTTGSLKRSPYTEPVFSVGLIFSFEASTKG